jgi:hypothetical protein
MSYPSDSRGPDAPLSARADGSLRSLLARLSRIDVLVIDDWAMFISD